MRCSTLVKVMAIAAISTVAGCQMSEEASRSPGPFDRASAPRDRSAEAIILGKDDVIRVSAMSPASYQRHLTQLARKFRRATDETIYFASGSAALTDTAKAALEEQAIWIAAHPEVRVSVTGYTDGAGSLHLNKALGMKRARAAVTFLVRSGVDRSRIVSIASELAEEEGTRETRDEATMRRVVTRVHELADPEPGDAIEATGSDLILAAGAGSGAPASGGTTGSGGGTTAGGTSGDGTTGGGTSGGGTYVPPGNGKGKALGHYK